ncbi:phage tail protein [Vreelandella aquamarina]|uniref:phage tail protein n=1 Tax=Vreelandella aquamarina TaxID=77097 RepID=UPI000781A797|nr:phage tail protein [Halomonas axialensis]
MDFLPDIGREPDYGLSGNPSFAVDAVQFGDGYEQRRPAGLNSVRRSWSVTWSLITQAQMELLRDWLLARKGVSAFLWDIPEEGETVQVVCKEAPSHVYTGFQHYSLTATFTEDFGL